ncbi:MAG: Ser-Thr-rich GPI-anchored membrane family protein [Acidobacteriota bacterium]
MKKISAIIFILLLSGLVFAGSIVVSSPNASSNWYIGGTYNITWTATNCSLQDYKINIFKNSISQPNFVEQLTVSGTTSKSWTIAGTYQPGNYVLRVKTTDGLCVGDSAVFSISDQPAAAPTITVTSPVGSSVWQKGSTQNITWTKTGTQSSNILINVFKDSISQPNFVEQLTGPNNGSKSWTIPGSYQSGNYILRVKPDDNSCKGDSPVFQITNAPQPVMPEIDITIPNSSTVWRKGITYDITWDKAGSQSSGVIIKIFKGSISQPNFLEQLTGPNIGSKSWKIPENYATGTYCLRITTDDNQVTDDSEPFKIMPKFQVAPQMVVAQVHGKIEILKPSTSSFWKEGTTHLIKWKNKYTKKKTIKIDLYNYSGKKFVRTITTILGVNVTKLYKGGAKPPDTSTYKWFISKGLGPAKYMIKISRIDGKASGMSDMFTVQIGTKVKTYEINGSFGNYCKRSCWAVDSGSLVDLESQVGNCTANGGASQGWSGYSNYAANHGKTYYGDIWRTHAYFDLTPFIGKGIILSAKLKYNKSTYPGNPGCSVSVYRLLASLGDAFNINGELINNPKSNMTSHAQSWMAYPNANYGIMFVGPDESFQHNQAKCKIFLSAIKLEIEFLEKE